MWLLRIGLAFAFVYAALSSLVYGATFAEYLPGFLPDSWSTELLGCFATYEFLLAGGLFSRRYAYRASLVAAMTLLVIVAINLDAFGVLFRNVAIACAALALASLSRPERIDPEQPHPLRDCQNSPPG